MEQLPKKPKSFYIISGVIIIIFLGVIGYFIYTLIFSAKLYFVIAPASAKVTMNNQTFSGGRYTKRVQPGEYQITVEKDGFETKTTNITATADQTTNVLVALTPNRSDTINWYIENATDSELNDEVGSRVYSEEQVQATADYPIIQDLPVIARYWALNYGNCPDNSAPLCLFVSAETGNYTYALEYLSTINDHNYLLSEYKIIFTNYENPFPNLTGTTAADYNTLLRQAANINYAAIVDGKISGDYYIGFISYYTPNLYPEEGEPEKDFYRIIIKKDGSNYKILTNTALIFYAKDYPDIPVEIINLANSQ